MKICSEVRELKENGQYACCYGAQGCTAAPLSSKDGNAPEETPSPISCGSGPKHTSTSEPHAQPLRLERSEESSLQNLYLLLRGLSDGGFEVSVTVQATPSKQSAPSPLDIRGLCGFSTRECPFIGSHQYWDAAIARLRSTMPSSKQSDLCNTCNRYSDMCACVCILEEEAEEPRNRRY